MQLTYKKCAAFFLLAIGMFAISGTGQVLNPAESRESGPNSNQNYRIGPGDVIDVIVNQNAALTRTGIRVNNLGRLQLPMIDEDLVAACRTERELADEVREKYRKFLLNPHVIVAVKEFNSNPVAVIGAVTTPGRFQLQRPIKVLELLTFVNGTSDKAGTTIELVRNSSLPYCNGSDLIVADGVGDEVILINLLDTLKGVEAANPYVRAGDILRVGEATQERAYVTGSVRTPSIINLSEPVTLTQAIAMSGGLASGAQSDKVIVRRQISGSVNRTEIAINLKEINQRKKDDLLLRPNDIVEVAGPGKLTTFFRALVPSLTQLPLRVVP